MVRSRLLSPSLFGLVLLFGACGTSAPRSAYLDGTYQPVSEATEPGAARFAAAICKGFDLTPAAEKGDIASLTRWLDAQHIAHRVEKAREDLYFVDVRLDTNVRLRVDVARDRLAAGRELHQALREHGPGSWGLQRGNLAVLAPISRLPDAIGFAERTRLACWGSFLTSGRDDVFAVGGAYQEL